MTRINSAISVRCLTDEPLQTEIGVTLSGVPRQKFTREQRIMLNKIKEQAEDVEFEEIQG